MRREGQNFAAKARTRGRGGGRWPSRLTGAAVGVVGALFISSGASAAGLDAFPDDPAEAEAAVFDTTVLGQDLAGGAHSEAGYPTDPGPNQEGLSLSLLGDE